IYRDTLGPYCYLLYSYLCLRSPFGIDFHRGTVHPGAWLHPGIDISALSKFPHEEVLLLSGFQFEIVDVKSFDPTEEKQFPHFHIQIIPRQCNSNV
ncbi:unnamed protein product, partial [Rotaria sp. Silwood1]